VWPIYVEFTWTHGLSVDSPNNLWSCIEDYIVCIYMYVCIKSSQNITMVITLKNIKWTVQHREVWKCILNFSWETWKEKTLRSYKRRLRALKGVCSVYRHPRDTLEQCPKHGRVRQIAYNSEFLLPAAHNSHWTSYHSFWSVTSPFLT
jgi:hypothetical protein